MCSTRNGASRNREGLSRCKKGKASIICALAILSAVLWAGPAVAQSSKAAAEEETAAKYSYYYKNELVSLNLSERFIAVKEDEPDAVGIMREHQLERNPLSDREPLRERGLAIYTAPASGENGSKLSENGAVAGSLVDIAPEQSQPVFEQGQALFIPSDELIVGFKEPTSLAEAQDLLEPFTKKLGILDARDHRDNIFILKIEDAENGRVYEVCRELARLDMILFAEPNHIVLMRYDSDRWDPELFSDKEYELVVLEENNSAETEQPIAGKALVSNSAPAWTTVANLDFESSVLPGGWSILIAGGATQAVWGRTSYRAHNGSHSLYCAAAGSSGVQAPGPAPTNMDTLLRSPVLNLTLYEEIYIEVWFHARNELGLDWLGNLLFLDCSLVGIRNATNNQILSTEPMMVPYAGDCTEDPTTDRGWRRLLFRIPPMARVANAYIEFAFFSNASMRFEGVYLDDIRIVGTTNVDAQAISNDTYSARQYELKNTGQIAGLGNDDNDMQVPEAWDLASVSPDVIVAVIDSGVDLTHPDLNLVTGYNYDGTTGGGPIDGDAHGTGCAGNVGAIKDNSVGVVGVAPGVKIMPVYSGATIANADDSIYVAVDQGADILSNSWGWNGAPSYPLESAIRYALDEGKVVLFAAGNGPSNPSLTTGEYSYDVAFPAILTTSTDLICVGASSPTDEHKAAASSDGQHAWGSSYIGEGPDVVAPGPWSYTTDIQGASGYNNGAMIDPSDPLTADYTPSFGGTSSATPKVAGIVALMLSANPGLTPGEAKQILRETADDIDAPGVDDKTGYGRVNAYRAVQRALSGSCTFAISPTGKTFSSAGGSVSVAVTASASDCSWTASESLDWISLSTAGGTGSGNVTVTAAANSGSARNGSVTIAGKTFSVLQEAVGGCDSVNLKLYKPDGWSDKIVVSNAAGSNTDSNPLYATDTLYVDWAVANYGQSSISSEFCISLHLDGVNKINWSIPSLSAYHYIPVEDYSIGSLGAGTHQIRIVVDSTNVVAETDETDNEYTKTIVVSDNSSGGDCGVDWLPADFLPPEIVSVTSVSYSNGRFVAAADYPGGFLTSPEGLNWTWQPLPGTQIYADVAWGGNQFIAVKWQDMISPSIRLSPDGVNWTGYDPGILGGLDLNGVAWGGGRYVAVGGVDAVSLIATSPDGMTWQSFTGGDGELSSVAWSGSRFVAVGKSPYIPGYQIPAPILTSSDGVSWSPQTSGTTQNLYDVAWGNDRFVAVGEGALAGTGIQAIILTSPDGVSWTRQVSGTTNDLRSVAWGGNQFVAVGINGTILTSLDGATWTARDSGTNNGLFGVVWGGDRFVAVGIGTALYSLCGVEPDVVPLSDGEPTAITVSEGQDVYFSIVVPTEASSLSFVLDNLTGDLDLFVKYGSKPTIGSFDCASTNYGIESEGCSFSPSQEGTYYAMVLGYEAGSGRLTATCSTNPQGAVSYVSPGNCGGRAPCFNLIQDAVEWVEDGDTVKVAAGAYDCQLELSKNIEFHLGLDSSFNSAVGKSNVESRLTIGRSVFPDEDGVLIIRQGCLVIGPE